MNFVSGDAKLVRLTRLRVRVATAAIADWAVGPLVLRFEASRHHLVWLPHEKHAPRDGDIRILISLERCCVKGCCGLPKSRQSRTAETLFQLHRLDAERILPDTPSHKGRRIAEVLA